MSENNCPTFVGAFRENMEALGMPVPTGVFETEEKILEIAARLVAPLKAASATSFSELVAGSAAVDALLIASGISAAAYAGAVVGSAAVATTKSVTCSQSILDVFSSNADTATSLDKLASINDPAALMAALSEYAQSNDGQEFARQGSELADAQENQNKIQPQQARGMRI